MTVETVGTFALEPFLQIRRARFEEALGRALETILPQLAPRMRAPVLDGVMTGGKRLRPVLCVTAYEVSGGRDREGILDVAVSLELIHAYSLMHDDLPAMDDAPLRRGRPTPHTVHGEEPTALAAAALIPAAHLYAWKAARRMGLSGATSSDLVSTLARAAGGAGMVGGQALDLLGEGQALALDELDDLHHRKTGALLTAALRMGGLAAEAPAQVLGALEAYGRRIGLAFQIADDVLDATADAEVLGKAPSDQALDKSTYVSLLGVAKARREAEGLVYEACEALRKGGIQAPALEALAHYIVLRDS